MTERLANFIDKLTLKAHGLLSRFISEEKLLEWKPIPLCWWYRKIGVQTPKYFIGHDVYTLNQAGYRFRNDDGSETTATWKAAENTPWAVTSDTDQVFRLRMMIQETGNVAGTTDALLQYSLNGGTYTTCTTTSNVIRVTASSNFTDGAATTNQIGGTGTFNAGQMRESNTASSTSHSALGHSEHEWNLTLRSADFALGDTINFRILRSGSPLSTISQTPSITSVAPPVEINSIEDLDNIRDSVSGTIIVGNFILMRDLDFNDDDSYDNPANKTSFTTGAGWVPLGQTGNPWFGASIDGDGHTISNLMVNSSTTGMDNAGLIGVMDAPAAGQTITIQNLGLIDPMINANATNSDFNQCGALIMGIDPAGHNIIKNCFVRGGTVKGGTGAGNNGTGGLIGISHEYSGGTVTVQDCYVEGTTIYRNGASPASDNGIGGLVGTFNQLTSGSGSALNITDSYAAAASINGDSTAQRGGLIGYEDTTTTYTTSYYDSTLTPYAGAGGTAKTTANFKLYSQFSSVWSIANGYENLTTETWWIDDGNDYPRLYYESPPGPLSVTSTAASNISYTQAVAGGTVADGSGITERGIVWALGSSADPTTGTNLGEQTAAGTVGSFSAQMTGLSPNTEYKVRAYAIDSVGTTYGSVLTFTTDAYTGFTASAVINNVGGGTTSVVLWNRTDDLAVANTEMSTTSATPVLVEKDFEYDETNFLDNKEYEFRIKVTSGTGNIWASRLFIRLKDLTKAQVYNRISRIGFTAMTAAAAATTERFLYESGDYSSHTADWIVTGSEDGGAGTNHFTILDLTTTDSGTTGSDIAGTEIDVNTASKVWASVTGIQGSLTNNRRYIGVFRRTSGGARYHQGILGINVTGTAGTTDLASIVELIDVPRSSVTTGTFEPIASEVGFYPSDYENATYYFEVVGTNSHATNAYGITLVAVNSLGTETDVTTQNLTANTAASNVRYRTSSVSIPSDTVKLKVRIAQTAASKNVVLGAARLIVKQVNANETKLQITMGGSNVESDSDTGNPFTITTATTYAALALNVQQFTIWKRDDTKYDSYYGSTPSFTITHTTSSNKKKSGTTLTHSTDSNKKKATTATHTTDASLVTKVWTYEDKATLPTTDALLANSYDATDRSNVATNDNVFKDLTGSAHLIEQVWWYHTNSVDEITGSWSGKSTLAPTSSTVFLQIYNHDTDTWETIDSDNMTAADTEFTLTGSQTDSLSDYYDTGNRVALRVYQEVV